MATLHIGTSGWSYDHWDGPFYPEDLPAEDRLDFYRRKFRAAEINNSFYHLPSEDTLAAWRETVPGGFVFTAKASRYITHMKKLTDPAESLERFLDRIRTLKGTLGAILFQLPPNWGFNPGRLSDFLEALRQRDPDGRHAFEFRDHSWLNDECYRLLADHGAALVMYHLAGYRSPREITAGFTYVRLHGPGDAYEGRYDGRTLRGWADVMERWLGDGIDVHCYFDNDEAGYAPNDALRLAGMLGQESRRR